MLTGPRKKHAYFVAPSDGLFLTYREEKNILYYTIIYNVWQRMWGLPNTKTLT
jgi:hypothetical protein